MAQVVKPKVREAGNLERLEPVAVEPVERLRSSVRVREHERALGAVLQLEFAERLEGLADERQDARLAVLCLDHRCPALLEINAIPGEAEQLAAAGARSDRELHEGLERLPLAALAGFD